MNNREIREYLVKMSEESYKRFSSSLILDNGKSLLGVRIPVLRKLAKEIAKADAKGFISSFPEEYFEDIMLKGFVTACGDFSYGERTALIKEHTAKIDNWSLCDSFVSSLKFVRENKAEFLKFLEPFFESSREYEVRFAIVCLLVYYNDKEYISNNLKVLSCIECNCFYANMAVSWALAEFCAKFPERVLSYLKDDNLSNFTHNKAICKIRESNKITKEFKEKANLLKR